MPIEALLLTLRARWRLVLGAFALTMAAALIASLLLPREYVSTAEILADVDAPEPISGSFAPTYPQQTQQFMATLVDVILSDRVVDKVIADLKLTEDKDALARWRRDTWGRITAKEYFSQVLRKHLEVKPTRESSVVALRYTASSPQFAAQAANGFVQAFLATQVELRSDNAKSNVAFFDSSTQKLRDNLEKAEARLSQYQLEKGILSTGERYDSELTRLNELANQVTVAQAQRLDTSARAQQSPSLQGAAPDVVQSPTVQRLRTELARAEENLRDVSTRVGHNHPEYQRAVAEVRSLKRQIKAETRQVVQDVDAANQVNLEREKRLRDAFEAQKAKVLAMTSQRDELNVLQKDVESAQRAYDVAKQRLSMNSLASQIDHTNVTLLAEAHPASRPAKPRIGLNTMIGALLGLLLGVASAMILEQFEPRLRSPGQAAQVLGLLILGSMPQNRPPLAASLRTALTASLRTALRLT
jgi:polysaccharide biosynthesis transport protein